MTTASETPSGTPYADLHHRHDRSCYWDHRRCGWVCPPPPTRPTEEVVPTVEPEPAAKAASV
ncbi:MAG TPA: hypothetical protein VD903_22320 [Pseudonocardia sp.]|nr:hypothetical protein [Pseudonocardia sp.]